MFPNFALLIVTNMMNEVLLLRRINTVYSNYCYSLPGGNIKYGETARQTVVRKIKNSVGLDVRLSDIVFKHSMYRRCNEPEFFSCFFQTSRWNGTICNGEPERHDDVRWFSVNELPENIVLAHKEALALIQQGIMYSEHGW